MPVRVDSNTKNITFITHTKWQFIPAAPSSGVKSASKEDRLALSERLISSKD
jgi:hypothetical protein